MNDIKANALLDAAISVESHDFDPGLAGLAYQKYFGPMFGKAPDPTLVGHYEKAIEGRLDGFERLLSKQKYLAGNVSL